MSIKNVLKKYSNLNFLHKTALGSFGKIGQSTRSIDYMGKTAASDLLKMFINKNDTLLTPHSPSAELYFQIKNVRTQRTKILL